MSKRLKEEMLETFRNRVNNATPLPWKVLKNEYEGNFGWVSEDTIDGITAEIYEYADAEFITHAREDVPALLDEIERMKEDMQEISEIVSSFYTEQEGIRLPLNLSPIAGELQVIHKIAGENIK